MAGRIAAWVLGILITGLYGYTVVAGVGNLILLPQMGGAMGLGISPLGWFWLVFGVALPVIVYALALVIARRRRAALRILVLAAGICLVSAVQLEVMVLVPQSSFFA